jgi:hypothetical protein
MVIKCPFEIVSTVEVIKGICELSTFDCIKECQYNKPGPENTQIFIEGIEEEYPTIE